jgi:hypothetical protein
VTQETLTVTSQPVAGLADIARTLRVFAAVAGKDGRISLPMSADEARAFANALDRLEAFPKETADFHAWADAKIAKMKKDLRKQMWVAAFYALLVAALIGLTWWA